MYKRQRLEWAKASPDAYAAMLGLEKALAKAGLERPLIELVYLRTSQINGCAYCVNMHANDARKAGETEQRLDVYKRQWHRHGAAGVMSAWCWSKWKLVELKQSRKFAYKTGLVRSDRII